MIVIYPPSSLMFRDTFFTSTPSRDCNNTTWKLYDFILQQKKEFKLTFPFDFDFKLNAFRKFDSIY